jgi:hypothetical protein
MCHAPPPHTHTHTLWEAAAGGGVVQEGGGALADPPNASRYARASGQQLVWELVLQGWWEGLAEGLVRGGGGGLWSLVVGGCLGVSCMRSVGRWGSGLFDDGQRS